MKKRDLALVVGGGVGFYIAWKYATRPDKVRWEDVSTDVPNSDRSHFIDIDGTTIHYQDFGEKSDKTIILIHGYTASTVSWAATAKPLAKKGFRVIALDLVGFGFSGKPKSFDYTINSQARMVERLMDRLGIGRATVVGHSYGGAVAATLALDYPERIEKLVSVAGVIDNTFKEDPMMSIARTPGLGEFVTMFLTDSRRFVVHRMKGLIAPENHHIITKNRVDHYHRALRSAETQFGMLQIARNWDADRIKRDASLIKQPTLLVWGDKDPVIPLWMGEYMYDRILQSRLVVFKNCGHLPAEERADTFLDLLVEFCSDSKGRIESSKEEAVNFGI